MTINKVTLIGRLGRDPEVRFMPSGDAVCNLSLATTDKWRDRTSGEIKEATEWHHVVLERHHAETAGKYLAKGSEVYIEGSLRTRKWTDQASGQERSKVEIRGTVMRMLGRAPDIGQDDPPPQGGQPRRAPSAPRTQQGSRSQYSQPAASKYNQAQESAQPAASSGGDYGDWDGAPVGY